MKYQQLQNGKFSVTLELPDDRQCTVKTDCTTAAEAKALAKAAKLETIESLARTGQLTAALIRKLTVGGALYTSRAIDEWKAWLDATANSELTAITYKQTVDAWYI